MRILQAGAVLASTTALLFATACGSSSPSGGSASPTPSSSGAAGFAAFTNCLRQHGVNVPTARPSARPSGRGGGFMGGGGGIGGGGGFAGGANQKAVQACRSLMPQFGGNRGRGMQELQAFRSCLSDHGVKLPTPSASRTAGASRTPGAGRIPGGGFGRFDTSDPKIAKAVKTCRPLLPSRTPAPSPSSS